MIYHMSPWLVCMYGQGHMPRVRLYGATYAKRAFIMLCHTHARAVPPRTAPPAVHGSVTLACHVGMKLESRCQLRSVFF